MEPAQPPLPTDCSFWFQFDTGIHTSILMSESLVGVNVAATRQNAGSFAYAPLVPALVPGGTNAPRSTTPAKVIRAFVNVSEDSGSHVGAGVDPSRRGSVRPTTPAMQRTTAAKVTHRVEFRMMVLAQREKEGRPRLA